jgi:methionyl-tRNA synthetase
VDELLGAAELSAALEEIWRTCAGSTATSRRTRPGRWRRTTAAAAELSAVLASLAEGLRVVTLALVPYMPVKTAALLDALDAGEQTTREFAPHGWGGRVSALAPLFPKAPRSPRDRLAHSPGRLRAARRRARGGGRRPGWCGC